ncbi:nucleotide pyrophosphohydrolase [Candidatus Woesearchaeota archaeon]|nr:nucleotide pyrophosphohydrolase [Nanoarchaeota archaeon]MCB9370188.1 nucleotide pyrophosphohydrolase [Candidatus Woesearchaeota archaeon]USN44716.1 MAG: nucleotide pyrophosphohydrolase [Candidatus Woesearchaeota archaeon]
MEKEIIKIFNLVKEKEKLDKVSSWGNTETYLKGLKLELEEVEIEFANKKRAYLEDELGDVFWTFCNLLSNLEKEKLIEKENVFSRCVKKFEERLNGLKQGVEWEETKKDQKKKLAREQIQLETESKNRQK